MHTKSDNTTAPSTNMLPPTDLEMSLAGQILELMQGGSIPEADLISINKILTEPDYVIGVQRSMEVSNALRFIKRFCVEGDSLLRNSLEEAKRLVRTLIKESEANLELITDGIRPPPASVVVPPKNKETQLFEAIRENNNDVVDTLLAGDIDPDTRNSRGQTPLMYAINNGNMHAVQSLHASGVNFDIQTYSSGATALIMAVDRALANSPEHQEIVDYLLANSNANTNIKNHHGMTVLDLINDRSNHISGALQTWADTVRDKVKIKMSQQSVPATSSQQRAVDLSAYTRDGANPDMMTLLPDFLRPKTSPFAPIPSMLPSFANPYSSSQTSAYTPIPTMLPSFANPHSSSQTSAYTPIPTILPSFATPHSSSQTSAYTPIPTILPSFATPYSSSQTSTYAPIPRMLPSFLRQTESEKQPNMNDLLFQAIENGATMATIRDLISSGANPDALNDKGWTPLIVAIKNRHFELAKSLILSGGLIQLNIQSRTGLTAFMVAVDTCCAYKCLNNGLLDAFITAGADATLRSNQGWNVLNFLYSRSENDDDDAHFVRDIRFYRRQLTDMIASGEAHLRSQVSMPGSSSASSESAKVPVYLEVWLPNDAHNKNTMRVETRDTVSLTQIPPKSVSLKDLLFATRYLLQVNVPESYRSVFANEPARWGMHPRAHEVQAYLNDQVNKNQFQILQKSGNGNLVSPQPVAPVISSSTSATLPNLRFYSEQGQRFMEAVIISDIATIRAMANRELLDMCDEDGNTPLIHAAQGNILESVQALIEAGANPRVRNNAFATASGIAHGSGHVAICRYLEGIGVQNSVSALIASPSTGAQQSMFAQTLLPFWLTGRTDSDKTSTQQKP